MLDVTLERRSAERPFAALRSMFVTKAMPTWRRSAGARRARQAGSAEPVMDFKRASAAELWAGRIVPSRHNTSAPDMVFRDFKRR